jgi:hypothetical protein
MQSQTSAGMVVMSIVMSSMLVEEEEGRGGDVSDLI